MVVERSRRRCLLCGDQFEGRAFVCRRCADRYRNGPIPTEVLRRFYHEVDHEYPEWANTYGNFNPPRALLKRLKQMDRTLQILEIGAGGGFLLRELWQAGFRRLTGSDITVSSLVEMRRRDFDLTVVGADAESLPFRNRSFDIVISSDVIEHLPRVNSHLSEVHRVLRPGGQYLFKTPNRRMAELYYLARGLYDHHIWHPSMFSPGEVSQRLAGYGFSIEVLAPEELTAAQMRKIPIQIGRSLARRLPLGRLPLVLQPHLEVVATRNAPRTDNGDGVRLKKEGDSSGETRGR